MLIGGDISVNIRSIKHGITMVLLCMSCYSIIYLLWNLHNTLFLQIYLTNNAVDKEVPFLLEFFLGIAVESLAASQPINQSYLSVFPGSVF